MLPDGDGGARWGGLVIFRLPLAQFRLLARDYVTQWCRKEETDGIFLARATRLKLISLNS